MLLVPTLWKGSRGGGGYRGGRRDGGEFRPEATPTKKSADRESSKAGKLSPFGAGRPGLCSPVGGSRIGVTSGRGDDLGLGSFLLPRHSQRVDSPESSSSSTPYVGGINSSCRKGNLGGRITEFSKFSKQLSLSSAPV